MKLSMDELKKVIKEQVNAMQTARAEHKEKSRLLGLALAKVNNDHKRLLKFLVTQNSAEWMAKMALRLGVKDERARVAGLPQPDALDE